MREFITKSSILMLILICASCKTYKNYNNGDISNLSDDQIIIAKYNNNKVTLKEAKQELNKVIIKNKALKDLTFKDLEKAQKELIIKEAIANKIILKKAKQQKLDDEKFNQTLKTFTQALLKEKFYNNLVKDIEKEENIKKKYDELFSKLKGKQDVRLRYIVLKTEKEAKATYKLVKKYPTKFSYYAKKRSIDKETAKKGGDVGYIFLGQLPENIGSKIEGMKKYNIAKPLQIGKNWVIIKLVDKKATKIAKFDDIKDILRKKLVEEKISLHKKDIVKNADIEFLLD